jgi:hypothetical protein
VTADFDEPDAESYIRGGGGISIAPRRFMRVVLVLVLVLLFILTTALFLGVIQKHSRISRLRERGVAVDVTVTSCLGMASGTGITNVGFRCSGTFTLDGIRHTEVISGNSANHLVGAKITAIVDPRDPSDLSTPEAVANTRLPVTDLLLPVVPALLFVTIAALGVHALWRPRPI